MNPSIVICMVAAGRRGRGTAAKLNPGLPRRAPGILRRRFPHRNSFGAVWALRNPVLARTLFQLRQKSFSSCAKVFQDHFLSAASSGLVGVFDGHEHAKGKMKCPTAVLKDLTK